MKIELWRILGNDLPPRHPEDQTEKNLDFILENEKKFGNTEKRFLLNRIVDKDKEKRILEKLKGKYRVTSIPFLKEEFDSLPYLTDRLNYLTNVNPARNKCIAISTDNDADIVCPMDGGMFFREDGWFEFMSGVENHPELGYYAFPTWRIEEYEHLLSTEVLPQIRCEYKFGTQTSYGLTELQLAVTKYHDCKFNENLMYGKADKVELLYKLGLLGLWDRWEPKLREEAVKNASAFYGKVVMCGFVCRLPSGNHKADHDNQIRGGQRAEGVKRLLAKVENL